MVFFFILLGVTGLVILDLPFWKFMLGNALVMASAIGMYLMS